MDRYFNSSKVIDIESECDVYSVWATGIDEIVDEVRSLGSGEAVEIINGDAVLQGKNARNMEKKGPKVQFTTLDMTKEDYYKTDPASLMEDAIRSIDPSDRYVRLSWVGPRTKKPRYTTIEDCIDAQYLSAGFAGDVEISGNCKGFELEGDVPSRSREKIHKVTIENLPNYPKTDFYSLMEDETWDDAFEYHEILEDKIMEEWEPEHLFEWAELEGSCSCEDWRYSTIAKDTHPHTGGKLKTYPYKFCAHKISAYNEALMKYQKLNESNTPTIVSPFLVTGPDLRLLNGKLKHRTILNKQGGRQTPNKAERNVLDMSLLAKMVKDEDYSIRTSTAALKEEQRRLRALIPNGV